MLNYIGANDVAVYLIFNLTYYYLPPFQSIWYPVHTQQMKKFFIERDLGEGFDFDNYNQLISKVLTNQKYNDLFGLQ